jgi:hypothetical protein
MVDPYRTPPARPDPWNRMYACTQNAPSCGDVPPDVMFAEVLREQAELQRKLLRLGRVMAAAVVVLSALPWVLIGLGPWPSGGRCTVVDEQEPIALEASVLEELWPTEPPMPPPASQVPAWPRDEVRASTALVRATARANEELLRAYERPDVTVHHFVVSQREAERISQNSGLRTSILPVEIKGGTGVKFLRLPAGDWFQRLGLKEGDTLVRFNGRRVSNPNLTLAAYADAQRAKHAVFELLRDGKPHVVSVTWDG